VSPAAAAKDWVKVQKVAQSFDPPLTLVSPAPAGRDFDADGKSKWLDEFFNQCKNVVAECNPNLIKYIAYHDYKLDTDGMKRRIDGMYKHYGNRPIWLTEFAMGYQWSSTPTLNEQGEFMKRTLTMLEDHPAIYRYVWFTGRASYSDWLGQHTLLVANNNSPTLTSLGQIYKSWAENNGSSPPPPPPPPPPTKKPTRAPTKKPSAPAPPPPPYPTKKPTRAPTKKPSAPPLAPPSNDPPLDLPPPSSDFTIDLKNAVCPDLTAKDKNVAPTAAACAALCKSDPGCDVWQYCPQNPNTSKITSCKLYEGNWSMGNWARCYISTSASSRGTCKADDTKKWTGAARGDSARYSQSTGSNSDGVPPLDITPITYQVVVQYDDNPGQTMWEIMDLDTGKKVAGVSQRQAKKFSKGKKYVKKGVEIVAGHNYDIIMKDKAGDGFPNGYIIVEAKRNSSQIWKKKVPGKFKAKKSVEFVAPNL